MKTSIMAAICVLLSAGNSAAQEWIGIDGTEIAIIGYDRASVRTVAGGRSVWVITVFRDRQDDDGQDYDYVVTRNFVDCENERARTSAVRSFKIGVEEPGRVINEESEWEYHQPESLFGLLVSVVCETSTLANRTPFSSADAFAGDARGLLTR